MKFSRFKNLKRAAALVLSAAMAVTAQPAVSAVHASADDMEITNIQEPVTRLGTPELDRGSVKKTSNVSFSAVSFGWKAVENADTYSIAVKNASTSAVTVATTAGTTFSLPQLEGFSRYSISVTPQQTDNGIITGTGDPLEFDTVTLPLVPAWISATSGNRYVHLEWTPASKPGVTYDLYRWSEDDDRKEAVKLPYSPDLTSASYTDTGVDYDSDKNEAGKEKLERDTKYNYYVVAKGTAGDEKLQSSPSDVITVTTKNQPVPGTASNVKVTSVNRKSVKLEWESSSEALKYRVYRQDSAAGDYKRIRTTKKTAITDSKLTPGTVYYYIVTIVPEDDTTREFDIDDPDGDGNADNDEAAFAAVRVKAVTVPEEPKNIGFSTTTTSVSISWANDPNYTGFIIYRYNNTTKKYDTLGTTTQTSYLDGNLTDATAYAYKVETYADTTATLSGRSDRIGVATIPKTPVSKIKGGNGRVRVSWKKIPRCTGYKIYLKNADGTLTETAKNTGRTKISKIITGLSNDSSYTYVVRAYKKAYKVEFDGEQSKEVSASPTSDVYTNTDPYTYKTKKALLKSSAWKVIKKQAVYNKSVVIPGLKSTNSNGFKSTNMCPQGMTIAGKYMLISAYDRDKEENSVIYVINRSSKKLLTTIALNDTAHVGGLAYDGESVWVASNSNVGRIPLTRIKKAANSGASGVLLKYSDYIPSTANVSFLAYYDDVLYCGLYKANKTGTLTAYDLGYYYQLTGKHGYMISKKYSITIPSRVQGAVFTKSGQLILSRAYSTTHELNIYSPKITDKKMTLGSRKKRFISPYLCEDMEIKGNILYVNYESAVSPKAPDHMDRVTALKLKKVLKK